MYCKGRGRNGKIGSRFTNQHRDRVLELRALDAHIDELGLRSLELGLRLLHVRLGVHSLAKQVLGEI